MGSSTPPYRPIVTCKLFSGNHLDKEAAGLPGSQVNHFSTFARFSPADSHFPWRFWLNRVASRSGSGNPSGHFPQSCPIVCGLPVLRCYASWWSQCRIFHTFWRLPKQRSMSHCSHCLPDVIRTLATSNNRSMLHNEANLWSRFFLMHSIWCAELLEPESLNVLDDP